VLVLKYLSSVNRLITVVSSDLSSILTAQDYESASSTKFTVGDAGIATEVSKHGLPAAFYQQDVMHASPSFTPDVIVPKHNSDETLRCPCCTEEMKSGLGEYSNDNVFRS